MAGSDSFDLAMLNSPQREAVEKVAGPVLILAGAGTGKTRVITSRICHMLAEGLPPTSILAVTFTNKAAKEMAERVRGMTSKSVADDLTICTFHSLCVRILRTSIDRIGYKLNFTIYDDSDQRGLIRKIIVRKSAGDEKLEPGLAQSLIGRCKNKGIPVSDDPESLISIVYQTYLEEMKMLNAVDFDDLLLLAERVLRKNDDIRRLWSGKFRYIMVDEFQDTNRLQMDLVRCLSGEEQNICVVGDDDQSIYSWRGAEISNILDFENFFRNPHIVKLEENYRSTNPILNLANSLIVHSKGRREKRLWSGREGNKKPALVGMPGEREEAEFVVSEIMQANSARGVALEDIAVLYRMNSQSRMIEQELRRFKIPYRMVGGQSFFDKREIKDLLAYFSVLLNPDDDVNLLRIINTPARGIGATTISRALEYSIQAKCSVRKALEDEVLLTQFSARGRLKIDELIAFLTEYEDLANTDSQSISQLTERLMDEIEYESYVRKTCKTTEEADMRRQNLFELIESLRRYEARAKKGKGLRGYLDSIALEKNKDDDIEKQKGVCLITMHAAKGLEFGTVFLIGLEEGILPHSRSMEEGTRDEERRLLYVGITRAMTALTMSFCQSRRRYGSDAPTNPSTFINEFDPDTFETDSWANITSRPATEEAADSYFEKMMAMLGEED